MHRLKNLLFESCSVGLQPASRLRSVSGRSEPSLVPSQKPQHSPTCLYDGKPQKHNVSLSGHPRIMMRDHGSPVLCVARYSPVSGCLPSARQAKLLLKTFQASSVQDAGTPANLIWLKATNLHDSYLPFPRHEDQDIILVLFTFVKGPASSWRDPGNENLSCAGVLPRKYG